MEHDRWQLETDSARNYETWLVPALMAPWASQTLAAAGVAAGDDLLDVGCGTGIVARLARSLVGPGGSVTGLDLNPGMLAIARACAADVTWVQADAAAIPFPAARFDCVTCQFALMFMPDPESSLREMGRVLKPGGRIAFATWGPIEESLPYLRLADIVREYAGTDAEAIVRSPFSMPEPGALRALADRAGLVEIHGEFRSGEIRYPTADAFIAGEFDGTPLGEFIASSAPETADRIRHETRTMLTSVQSADGISFAGGINLVSGRKAASP